ncbi:MAG: hypothetical protein RLZZ203_2537 [Cyanobacteriota bacterium]
MANATLRERQTQYKSCPQEFRTYAKNSQTLIPLCSLRPGAVCYSVTRA